MKLSRLKYGLLVGIFIVLAGCGGNKKGADQGTTASGAGEYGTYSGQTIFSPEEADEMRKLNTFYFDYDSSAVKADDVNVIEAHAFYLTQNPQARVRVEGHTDARGSREYNIALGERRAQAVARVLFLAGVPQHQVAVVSFGSEKPAVQGNDEAAWQYNRRAIIVYEVE